MTATFRVLTFNTMKLGTPVAPRDVLAEVMNVEFADGTRVAPDVVGFQEVFNTSYSRLPARNVKKQIEKALGDDFVLRWDRASGPPILPWFQDGVLVAARKNLFKIVDSDQICLGKYGTFERRVGQYMALELDGGLAVHVYNSHLSVGDDNGGRRIDEIGKMLGFIRRKEEASPAEACLWTGDFNSGPDTEEYRAVTCEGFQDTWEMAEAPEAPAPRVTLDPTNTLVDDGKEARRIDYIFLQAGPAARVTGSEIVLYRVIDGNNLSDHYGVVTTLEIGS